MSLSGRSNESMYHITMANSDTLFHDRQKVDGRVFRAAKLLPYEVKVIQGEGLGEIYKDLIEIAVSSFCPRLCSH